MGMSQERITAEQYRQMLSETKPHKYGAKKTVVDGIKFDSKREADYYCELKLLKRSSEIKDFTLQPEFVLLDSFKKYGKTIRGIKYRADFKIIHKDGSVEIIDVKGFKTKDFLLKQKLFDKQFPDLKLTLIS
jgi:hypothetical protein